MRLIMKIGGIDYKSATMMYEADSDQVNSALGYFYQLPCPIFYVIGILNFCTHWGQFRRSQLGAIIEYTIQECMKTTVLLWAPLLITRDLHRLIEIFTPLQPDHAQLCLYLGCAAPKPPVG